MSAKNTIIEILNCFETGKAETNYTAIYLYRDGPHRTKQVTLGRGYTEEGTLWDVFSEYKSLGGESADKLLAYKSSKGKETLASNKEFLNLLITTAKTDQKFRNAEDAVYDIGYWNRGDKWVNKYGFTLPLSMLVIQDSFLQSGSMLQFLMNKFTEKTPIQNGNEKAWIKAYSETRENWLKNHSNKILNSTVYRPKFFLDQIEKNNWNLDQFPIFPNGVRVSI
jgi:chitosanase